MKRPPRILTWFILALPISGQTAFAQDCNFNGVPDQTDLAEGTSADCNGNQVPDECDIVASFKVASGPLSPIGNGVSRSFLVRDAPEAVSDVVLTITASADLSSSSE